MRIRRCASRLLGTAVSVPAPGRFELPPPSPRFELPPPAARESHAGVASKNSSSSPEPCPTCLNPVDLMNQFDLSDPEEVERFEEEYTVPLVRRASWLLPVITPVGSIKEDEEEEEMAVDMVEEAIRELHLAEEKKAALKAPKKENQSKPKTRKGKEKTKESDEDANDAGGEVWTRKKNDGKSDQKLPGSFKQPRRKRVSAIREDPVGGPFYFYARFPSRSKRQHRGSSSRSVPEPLPTEEEEEEQLPEEHIDVTPGTGQVQNDVADHQVVPSARVGDEPRCDDADMARIAGYDEMISSDGEPAGNIKRNSPVKKRRRKPVKARSINSLM